MSNLDKLRDELAEAYATGNHRASFADTYDEKAFRAGFDSAIKHIDFLALEQAGEFDEKAAWERLKVFEATQDRSYRGICVSMARWQFEEDAARIGLAESKLETQTHNMNVFNEEYKQLTARAEKAERERDELAKRYPELLKDTCVAQSALQEKLAAEQAKNADYNRLWSQNEMLQQRVRELEAERIAHLLLIEGLDNERK